MNNGLMEAYIRGLRKEAGAKEIAQAIFSGTVKGAKAVGRGVKAGASKVRVAAMRHPNIATGVAAGTVAAGGLAASKALHEDTLAEKAQGYLDRTLQYAKDNPDIATAGAAAAGGLGLGGLAYALAPEKYKRLAAAIAAITGATAAGVGTHYALK